MNTLLLKEYAVKLRAILLQLSALDTEVQDFLNSIKEIIDSAIDEKIYHPLEWDDIPGAYFFLEGNMQKYRDVEELYSLLKIELSGGATPAMKSLLEKIKNMPER